MIFSNKKLIGLDLGSSTIKLAELNVSGKNISLLNFGILPTPKGGMKEGELSDTQRLSGAVRQLITGLGVKRKKVACGLWGSSIIVKKIQIPRMEEALIAEQIRWEAEQYIPFDISEVSLDFKILKTRSHQNEILDLLLIAGVQDSIFKQAEVINLSGLSCSVVDVDGFALANTFEANYGILGSQVIGLINIGCHVTNFSVLEGGEVVFCRDLPVGGHLYTAEISRVLGVSEEEAEAIKLSVSSAGEVPDETLDVIANAHELMVEEISNGVQFFHNTSEGSEISKIFVTGGGSKTPGLFERLEEVFVFERLDPFTQVKVANKHLTQDFISQIKDFSAIAVGLGLRKEGDS